jgi:cobaltochelatase CobS
VRLLVAAIASQQAQASANLDTAAVQALIDASLDRVITKRIEVATATETRTVEGLAHYQLPTLIRMVSTGQNVWLTGPSGAGKTHAAEQVAQALGLTYYFQGAMSMPHDLLGFVDANGKYHITPFVQAYESGGLLLLDELDSGSNEALLTLNAALSNGHTALPDGRMIKRHAQFRCVGGANTYGQGATAEYVGRTKLDAAFLQRFPVRLAWTYDERLERAMAGNDDWTDKVQKARAKAQAQGLKILITPRTTVAGADLIRAGFSLEDAAEYTYLAGLTPAQRDAIK